LVTQQSCAYTKHQNSFYPAFISKDTFHHPHQGVKKIVAKINSLVSTEVKPAFIIQISQKV